VSVSKQHIDWFAALKPGDVMALRSKRGGHYGSGPWLRVVVKRASGSTAWWEGYGDPSVTARSRNHEARPPTPEDEARWLAEEQDARIRKWLADHVPPAGWGTTAPLHPDVRAALLAAIERVTQ